MSRVFGFLVFQNVDFADILVAVGFVPFLIEADEADGRGLADKLIQFFQGYTELAGQFFGAGRPSSDSSDLRASSSLLALLRTSRGTQSMVRSSSSIAPRILGTQ